MQTTETKSKHTPGPWLVYPFKAFVLPADRLDPDDAPICAMLWPTDKRSEEETQANARLIASAPELLEALKYARRFLKPDDVDMAFIDAAILKAEGR